VLKNNKSYFAEIDLFTVDVECNFLLVIGFAFGVFSLICVNEKTIDDVNSSLLVIIFEDLLLGCVSGVLKSFGNLTDCK
jgi:hypothetical protein